MDTLVTLFNILLEYSVCKFFDIFLRSKKLNKFRVNFRNFEFKELMKCLEPNTDMEPFEPLNIPFENSLFLKCGYSGEARYVGFWIVPAAEDIFWTDGIVTSNSSSELLNELKDTKNTLESFFRQLITLSSESNGIIVDRETNRTFKAEIHLIKEHLNIISVRMGLISPILVCNPGETVDKLLSETKEKEIRVQDLIVPMGGAVHRRKLN